MLKKRKGKKAENVKRKSGHGHLKSSPPGPAGGARPAPPCHVIRTKGPPRSSRDGQRAWPQGTRGARCSCTAAPSRPRPGPSRQSAPPLTVRSHGSSGCRQRQHCRLQCGPAPQPPRCLILTIGQALGPPPHDDPPDTRPSAMPSDAAQVDPDPRRPSELGALQPPAPCTSPCGRGHSCPRKTARE